MPRSARSLLPDHPPAPRVHEAATACPTCGALLEWLTDAHGHVVSLCDRCGLRPLRRRAPRDGEGPQGE